LAGILCKQFVMQSCEDCPPHLFIVISVHWWSETLYNGVHRSYLLC